MKGIIISQIIFWTSFCLWERRILNFIYRMPVKWIIMKLSHIRLQFYITCNVEWWIWNFMLWQASSILPRNFFRHVKCPDNENENWLFLLLSCKTCLMKWLATGYFCWHPVDLKLYPRHGTGVDPRLNNLPASAPPPPRPPATTLCKTCSTRLGWKHRKQKLVNFKI